MVPEGNVQKVVVQVTMNIYVWLNIMKSAGWQENLM